MGNFKVSTERELRVSIERSNPLTISSEAIQSTARCMAAALIDDPFYYTITLPSADTLAGRVANLATYMEYSIIESPQYGFTNVADGAIGGAVWVQPYDESKLEATYQAKQDFLARLLGPAGYRNYRQMLDFMHPFTEAAITDKSTWYLSILGVCPDVQGGGRGATLIGTGLALADAQSAPCYLEAFNPRVLNFYRRHGFEVAESNVEPLTGRDYYILKRPARL